MSKDTGGPAFPLSAIDARGKRVEGGMTLRDYFAAKAMAVVWTGIPDDVCSGLALEHLGRLSYEMADAMLAERAK